MAARKKTNGLVMLVCLVMLAGLTGCARISALDPEKVSDVEKAAYPALLPEDALPTRADSEADGAAIAGNLDARAAALRARAAALLLLNP
jgi:hypothetical protein